MTCLGVRRKQHASRISEWLSTDQTNCAVLHPGKIAEKCVYEGFIETLKSGLQATLK
jgi:hypothetical protein